MLNQNGRLKEEAAPPTGSHSAQQTQQSTHTHSPLPCTSRMPLRGALCVTNWSTALHCIQCVTKRSTHLSTHCRNVVTKWSKIDGPRPCIPRMAVAWQAISACACACMHAHNGMHVCMCTTTHTTLSSYAVPGQADSGQHTQPQSLRSPSICIHWPSISIYCHPPAFPFAAVL